MLERYSRQILFTEIGEEGQKKLQTSKVLIVGCGALGSAQAEILTRAGVGHLRLVDRDFVEFSNLQRQSLFDETDARQKLPKTIAAKRKLEKINSNCMIEAIVADVNNSNIERLISDVDLVLDGTDNFQTRYLINDACVKHKKPWIYGAAVSSYGTTMTILPHKSACLRCVFEEIPSAASAPTCETVGIIQPIISIVVSIQVTEAIKIITDKLEKLHRSIIQIDVWNNQYRAIKIGQPQRDCICCGFEKYEFLSAEWRDFATVLCGRKAVQILPANQAFINLQQLAEKLKNIGPIKQNEYLIRLNLGEYELTVFNDARAIIQGTDDISVARSIYSKYVGV
ncbi:MAG: thiazole biosynthesis adenylyltransferase ThiF [Acidobacteria bacterium]|nr:MAG: thiazole biosynthesis adenylyltransferase ThiF [Acidobacteriota bacterium]